MPTIGVAIAIPEPWASELQDFECSFDAAAFSLYVHDASDGWVPTREFELG